MTPVIHVNGNGHARHAQFEQSVHPLRRTPIQRILLVTDGTVTEILEAFTVILAAAAMGLFLVAGTSGLLGIDMHPQDHAPRWVGLCAGMVFVAGGLAICLQSFAVARPAADGGLSPDSPRWAQWACRSPARAASGPNRRIQPASAAK